MHQKIYKIKKFRESCISFRVVKLKKNKLITTILLITVMILPLLAPVVAYEDANPYLTSRKEAVVSYLVAHLDTSSGGFSENDVNTDLATTYRAITSLSLLGVLSEIYTVKTVTWIDTHRNTTNGGYSSDPNNLDKVSIYATSYAMGSLIVLGQTNEIQSDVTTFIDSLQNSDGGYGNMIGNKSTITNTFLALQALKSYNSMGNIDNATAYLWSKQNNNSLEDNYGAFITNSSQTSYTIMSSWDAVNGLYQVLQGSIVVNNTNALINWVAACQNLAYNTVDKGGISNSPIEDSSQMIYTYAASGIVNLLDRKSDLELSSLKSWILNHQNADGGFSSSSSTTSSSVSTTYYALLALNYIDGNLNSLFVTVPWQVYPEFSVVLIVVLIVIAAVIVAIFIKKRYY